MEREHELTIACWCLPYIKIFECEDGEQILMMIHNDEDDNEPFCREV